MNSFLNDLVTVWTSSAEQIPQTRGGFGPGDSASSEVDAAHVVEDRTDDLDLSSSEWVGGGILSTVVGTFNITAIFKIFATTGILIYLLQGYLLTTYLFLYFINEIKI